MLTVVLDTINAFFSSPFSENSTSLQVSSSCWRLLCGRGVGAGVRVYIFILLVAYKDTAEEYKRVLVINAV